MRLSVVFDAICGCDIVGGGLLPFTSQLRAVLQRSPLRKIQPDGMTTGLDTAYLWFIYDSEVHDMYFPISLLAVSCAQPALSN